jgi:hypothetical protein
MRHGALTIVAPITPERVEELRARLDEPGRALRAGMREANNPLASVPGIHFARWVVVPTRDGYGPLLAFESNFDGEEEAHLDDLAGLGDRLDAFYELCVGYPEIAERSAATRREYLRAHSLPYGAWHNGHPGLPVGVVRSDERLVEIIQRFLDTNDPRRLRSMTPFEIRDAIRAHVREQKADHPELVIDSVDRGLPSIWSFVLLVATLAALLLALLGWLVYLATPASLGAVGALLLAIVGVVGYVFFLEDREARTERRLFPIYERAHDDHMLEIVKEEDNQPQNPLSHVVDIKEGRGPVLGFVLWLIELLARNFYFRGALGSITSIHFGRWVLIDGGKRLLFFSNYDGSWESYLGDFVDRTSPWLTAVWSNTEGFPNTTLLFFYGAKDEGAFKRWTRSRQIPTQLWYSAYPGLSVFNVLNNAEIREGLFRDMTESQTKKWLARL